MNRGRLMVKLVADANKASTTKSDINASKYPIITFLELLPVERILSFQSNKIKRLLHHFFTIPMYIVIIVLCRF